MNTTPRLVSIHSHKGGVGKSTLALFLACKIAEQASAKSKVCLLDFDYVGPSLGFAMGFDTTSGIQRRRRLPLHSWFDQQSSPADLDASDIKNYIWRPRPSVSGRPRRHAPLHLLCSSMTTAGVVTMERADIASVTGDKLHIRLQKLVEALGAQGYEYIIIDNTTGFRSVSLASITLAHWFGGYGFPLFVSSPDKADLAGIIYQVDTLWKRSARRFP